MEPKQPAQPTQGNFQIPNNSPQPQQPTGPQASGRGDEGNASPKQAVQPIQELAEQLQEEPPKAQEEALKEPVLIPRNPVAIILRIMGLLALLDLAFLLVVGVFVYLGLSTGLIFLVFFIFQFVKIIGLAFLVFSVLLPWANTGFYLSESQLERKRLRNDITTDEITYELRNIEGVKLHQSILGRMFDYGDITLRMMTDNPKKVEITDIKDPTHYKNVFDKYISVNI